MGEYDGFTSGVQSLGNVFQAFAQDKAKRPLIEQQLALQAAQARKAGYEGDLKQNKLDFLRGFDPNDQRQQAMMSLYGGSLVDMNKGQAMGDLLAMARNAGGEDFVPPDEQQSRLYQQAIGNQQNTNTALTVPFHERQQDIAYQHDMDKATKTQLLKNEATVEAAKIKAKGEGGPNFKDERSLAKEWSSQVDEFKKLDYQYNVVEQAAKQGTGPGDIGLVFAIMKMFDPNSVVRESEYAVAANAQGVPQRLETWLNKLKAGEQLSPELRAEFVNVARELYKSTNDLYHRKRNHYHSVATQYGFDPSRIVFDYQRNSDAFGGGASGNPAPNPVEEGERPPLSSFRR